MRLAVCSWSLQPTDPKDLVQKVTACGLDRVQLALSPVVRDPDIWGTVFAVLQDAGIAVESGMMETVGEDYSSLESIAKTGGLRPDEHWPANLEHAERVATLASEHQLALVTFHAGFLPHEAGDPERKKLLGRLREVAEVFAAGRVKLGLETGQESAPTLASVLAELDHPNVGVNFDPANMILYAMGDPLEALRVLQSSVVQIHVKDATPTKSPGTWGAEVPVGSGAVSWPDFFAVAKACPASALVIEREAGSDRVADISAAKQCIQSSGIC
ncbi:MAG: xylose isomerase [Phycisphaerae bacterium]|nr:xylose isomerase [Phycisphaerae bacterium]